MTFCKRVSSDEYKMKGVEEVKYMKGEENRVNARNQENLVRHTRSFMHRAHTHTRVEACSTVADVQVETAVVWVEMQAVPLLWF